MKPPSRLEQLMAAARAHAPGHSADEPVAQPEFAARLAARADPAAEVVDRHVSWVPAFAWGLVVCGVLTAGTMLLPRPSSEKSLPEFDLLAGVTERPEPPF